MWSELSKSHITYNEHYMFSLLCLPWVLYNYTKLFVHVAFAQP